MPKILKVFPDHLIQGHTTYWLVLECQHWYHWMGPHAPKADTEFQCPNCAPVPEVVMGTPPVPREL